MRLYLSSHQCGNAINELFRLVGTSHPKALVITNASDFLDEAQRKQSTENELGRLREVGIEAEELDLRDYFNNKTSLATKLENTQLLWVRGGNTFLLRRALYLSGADVIITKLLTQDSIVYGGHSAGIAVLAPSLDGLEIVDDPEVLPSPYSTYDIPTKVARSGMSILPYYLAPHYQSDFIDSQYVDALVEYFKRKGYKFQALHDGEVLVIDGDASKVEL